MASPEPSAAAAAGAGGDAASQTAAVAVEQIHLPTPEEMKAQEVWNNCVVRSVMSGVMGNDFFTDDLQPNLFYSVDPT